MQLVSVKWLFIMKLLFKKLSSIKKWALFPKYNLMFRDTLYLILSFFSTAVSNCFGPWTGFVEDNSSPDWQCGDGFRMIQAHYTYCALTLLLRTRVPFPNKISCFVSTCVSLDNSFPSVRQEPSVGPWKGSPFLQQMATLVGTLLHWDWHPDHSGYSGASLPANGPDPAATTGTPLSLVSSWCGQLARVPRPVRNKRLYWPVSHSLSLSSP